jgi:uncharacterized tellurite resistance protein B-like protein
MDKFRTVFSMLYLVSRSDKAVSDDEIRILNDFIHVNYGSINFDPESEIASCEKLDEKSRFDKFRGFLDFLKKETSTAEKEAIIKFCNSVVMVDQVIDKTEKSYMDELHRVWNISS